MRLIAAAKVVLVIGVALHLHLHHEFHGPAIDYAAVIVASFASWAGAPGPGEPVLIAAGVIAAKHNLDIVSVVFVAWLAAMAGGVAGWLVGLYGGRAVITAPGPIHRFRVRAVERGDEVFQRLPVMAIILTPAWAAGINRSPARVYLPVNALSAFVWAAAIGFGAYFIGPPIIDVVDDVGWVMVIALVALVLLAVLFERQRRRRKVRLADAAERGPEHPPPRISPKSDRV